MRTFKPHPTLRRQASKYGKNSFFLLTPPHPTLSPEGRGLILIQNGFLGVLASWRFTFGFILFSYLIFGQAFAYPDFQAFIKKNSGRAADCAFCHVNPNGPEGNGPGQLGSLTPEEFNRLNYARAAFEPGRSVHSPILNAFGNRIISDLGKKNFLEFKTHPKDLAESLGKTVDLDGDGISDSQEYLDGTHPLKNTDGDPLSLLLVNLSRNRFHVIILILATLITLWGLNNIFRGFIRVFEDEDEK